MTWFNNLTVRWKLLGSLGAVLLLLGAVAAIGLKDSIEIDNDFNSLYADRLQPAIQLANAQQALYELRVGALVYVTMDEATRQRYRADEPKWLKQVDDNMQAYAATYLIPEEQALLREWQQAYPAYVQARQRSIDLTDQGDVAAANANVRVQA